MPVKKRDAARTRATILKTAEHLFARQGFAATSMRNIADTMDIKAATMYHYFPSKEELLNEIFRDFYNDLAELYARVNATMPAGAPVRTGLVHFMEHHRAYMAERKDGAYLFFLEALRPGSPAADKLKGFAADAGKQLTAITQQWSSLTRQQAMTLIAAVIAIDVFMEVAAPYLKNVLGASPAPKKQLTLITLLLSGEDL